MRSALTESCDRAHTDFMVARAALLRAVSHLAERERWRDDGASSLAAWLSARYEVSYAVAREWVEAASGLAARPDLADAYGAGQVSCDRVKAINTLAAPGEDGYWLEVSQDWPVDRLRREARKAKARELERRDDGRYCSIEWTRDERYVKVAAQLHPEEGSLLMKAIDRAVPDGTPWQSMGRYRADGLVELARARVADDADPDRATIVVHVQDDAPEDVAELEDGGFIGAETARRLACDARIELVGHDRSRRPVSVRPASRNVPAYLRRQLKKRDVTCAFPGCERRRFVEAHHVVPFGRGGPTRLDNLVLLCSHHHHLVHEGGWSLRGKPGVRLEWMRPDGSSFEPRMPVSVDTS